MINNLDFNSENYIFFNDYKNVMINAFGIGCSLCGAAEIIYVLKGSPKPIGSFLNDVNGNLTDQEIEKLIEKPITDWQNFEDNNSEKFIPTFICSECWNSSQE
ncbi:hypothetical protein ESOMN_v1c04330 [Williamsoniiplasma somnilux]|uniref:Uncharacterized protein n=1 Tax=Williamsoniiplasma somnilux TaxID=215578 RepID=A0A2K8NYA9_9MOLU|nr:hypothetical protein [Williamsoniiplasma somnilux]ATZ18815.1 hypothetical protein ESOMN_v1c04330 [Williamsoniiplasma somnilux]